MWFIMWNGFVCVCVSWHQAAALTAGFNWIRFTARFGFSLQTGCLWMSVLLAALFPMALVCVLVLWLCFYSFSYWLFVCLVWCIERCLLILSAVAGHEVILTHTTLQNEVCKQVKYKVQNKNLPLMGLFYGLCNVNPLMASRLIYYVPSWKKVYKSHSHNVGLCVFWMVCFLYNNSTPSLPTLYNASLSSQMLTSILKILIGLFVCF